MPRVVLSLGTNLGNRRLNMAAMVREVKKILLPPVRMSRLMETEPVGVDDKQKWYLNRLVCGGFDKSALELLVICLSIEQKLGRVRTRFRQSRTADIDILLFGDQQSHKKEITIPHPELLNRRFCIEGIRDCDPRLTVPGLLLTIEECHAGMPEAIRSQKIRFLNVC